MTGEDRLKGVVQFYDADKCFGFIRIIDRGVDAFFSTEVLERSGVSATDTGDVFMVQLVGAPDRLRARDMELINYGGPQIGNGRWRA